MLRKFGSGEKSQEIHIEWKKKMFNILKIPIHRSKTDLSLPF